jgi:hypothetical protein
MSKKTFLDVPNFFYRMKDSKDQDELLQILEEQLKIPENKLCADCKHKSLFVAIK